MFQFPFRAPQFAFSPDLQEFERLPATSVYKIIAREGRKEMRRPAASLWWSSVAAGFAMAASVVGVAALSMAVPADAPGRQAVIALGYPFGFLIVILSRLQLFTENTITPILPLLLRPNRRALIGLLRLWAIVLAGNLAGALAAAALAMEGGLVGEPLQQAMLEVSAHAIDLPPLRSFSQGVLAGFVIAALVWMLPSLKHQEFIAIFALTYLIGAAGAPHVIAGAVETFVVAMRGTLPFGSAVLEHILPTLAGNVVGGAGLFAALAYGQVWRELQNGPAPPPTTGQSEPSDKKDTPLANRS